MKNLLLHQLVTANAESRPAALALGEGNTSLTYGELEEFSSKIARSLQDAGCKPGDRIGILIPKSSTAIASILGVLKAGCIYTPLDTSSPADRLARILECLEAKVMLAAGNCVPLLSDLADHTAKRSLRIGWLDETILPPPSVETVFTLNDVLSQSASSTDNGNGPDDLAYILFTSGSTGTPKGVPITHANVLRYLQWATKYFNIVPSDRNSGHIPLHFDLSVFDMFGAFAAGASIHLVPQAFNILPAKIAEFIRTSELTQWFSVPSILNLMAKFDVVKQGDFPRLKRLLWCGEVFPTPSLRYFMHRLPHVTFTNLYGPTEATIASSYYTVPACPADDTIAIPIGEPCDGESLYVLDKTLQECLPGVIGDLYIGGGGLSPGYWRDPVKTNEAFLEKPSSKERLYKTGDLAKIGPDGFVYFVGREDSQIKSRGYRVELGEIETALSSLDTLQESAVVAIIIDGFEGTAICCAYVPKNGSGITPARLRTDLIKKIPRYMIPSRWTALDQLPKNANGKIDRPELRRLFSLREQPSAST